MSRQPDSLVVYGAGGHGKVACAIAELSGWKIEAVLDDSLKKQGERLLGYPIVGLLDLEREGGWDRLHFHLAIGANRLRRRLVRHYPEIRWTSLVHPCAFVHPTAKIGVGTLVSAGAIVQPDARVGRHVIINTGAIVEHDNLVGDFVHVGPNATLNGMVEVGTGAFVGAAAVVLPRHKIGEWAVIGAGAVVTRDVPDAVIATGVPCRPRVQQI